MNKVISLKKAIQLLEQANAVNLYTNIPWNHNQLCYHAVDNSNEKFLTCFLDSNSDDACCFQKQHNKTVKIKDGKLILKDDVGIDITITLFHIHNV